MVTGEDEGMNQNPNPEGVATEDEETTSRTKASIQPLDSLEKAIRFVNNTTNLISSPKEDEEEINLLTDAEEISLLTDEEGKGKEQVGDVKVQCV